jgi:hypothetical protein
MPAALDEAIPSFHAWHEKQRLLFFAESLMLLHRWHCHKAAREEADLNVLGISPRIGSGGSKGVEAALWRCPWRKIWEEKTVPVSISRAYMHCIWY